MKRADPLPVKACVAAIVGGLYWVSTTAFADDGGATSIAVGRTVFERHCTLCHGRDGKAHIAVIARATDLTSPELYYHGTDDAAIFNSITNGAGNSMPAFKEQISEEDRHHLVDFIKSLWAAKNK
jgi:mono/diheme cytochrome c family protein